MLGLCVGVGLWGWGGVVGLGGGGGWGCCGGCVLWWGFARSCGELFSPTQLGSRANLSALAAAVWLRVMATTAPRMTISGLRSTPELRLRLFSVIGLFLLWCVLHRPQPARPPRGSGSPASRCPAG